jgi:ribonuclease BN (tRNA processing enzyme)
MSIRLEVLGFAGAAPLQGACPSYLVAHEDTRVLLDCGPGTLERLWRRRLLERVEAIIVSHMHAEHVLDLVLYAGELVRSLLGERRVTLYVPRGDGPAALRRLDAAFAREPDAPTRFERTFAVSEYDDGQALTIGDLAFSFAATAHAQPCYAARVSDEKTVVVYGADGAPCAALDQLATGADLLSWRRPTRRSRPRRLPRTVT